MNVPEEFGSRVPGGRAAGAMPPAKERRPLEATADEGARPGSAMAAAGAWGRAVVRDVARCARRCQPFAGSAAAGAPCGAEGR
jgi:hypothetical protein